MNRQTDNERLLADVLADENAGGFREALFSETLRLAHRRRHFRQTRRAVSVAAVFVGLALFAWRSLPPQISPAEATQKNYAVVHSQPLPTAAVVLTRPLAINHLVASFTGIQLVQTTRDGGTIREIGDDELLGLVEPKPAALVRLGPHTAELVILNPVDDASPPN